MMSYCNNAVAATGGGGGGAATGGGGGSSPPNACSSAAGAGTPPVTSAVAAPNVDPDDDIWRGHSIAALRRRASEINAAIPSYLQINYDTHNNASVY